MAIAFVPSKIYRLDPQIRSAEKHGLSFTKPDNQENILLLPRQSKRLKELWYCAWRY